tara:strand:+ start:3577 stop:3783 length:207 start_codon:yes stop_codon:yes gene_type:complete
MTKQWIQLDDAVINLSKVDVVHKTYYGVSNSNIPVITFTIGEEEVWCERFESVEERDHVFSQILEMLI